MLELVLDHADQAHAQGDGRVPAAVDHPVQVAGPQALHELEGAPGHGGAVATEKVGAHPHLRHLLAAVAIAVGALVEGQPEAFGPSLRSPRLFLTRHLAHVVVLDPPARCRTSQATELAGPRPARPALHRRDLPTPASTPSLTRESVHSTIPHYPPLPCSFPAFPPPGYRRRGRRGRDGQRHRSVHRRGGRFCEDRAVSDEWFIQPNGPLVGDVQVYGSKNAVTKHMVAAILGDGPSTISNVPEVGDVQITADILGRSAPGWTVATGARDHASRDGLPRCPCLSAVSTGYQCSCSGRCCT